MLPIPGLKPVLIFSLLGAVGGTGLAQEIQWRQDYQAARQEAQAKNRPLFLDFGTENCSWCKKLDLTTFRQNFIIQLLNEQFIPVKIKAEKEPELVQLLKIQTFPTLVLAGADGKILEYIPGYAEAEPLRNLMHRTLAQLSGGNNGIVLAKAEVQVPVAPDRKQQARQLLTQAQEELRQGLDACCLVRCQMLALHYTDLPEATQAQQLASQVKNDPLRASVVRVQLVEVLGNLYLETAEDYLRKNQVDNALVYLERVLLTCPGTRHSQVAQSHLTRLHSQIASPEKGRSPAP